MNGWPTPTRRTLRSKAAYPRYSTGSAMLLFEWVTTRRSTTARAWRSTNELAKADPTNAVVQRDLSADFKARRRKPACGRRPHSARALPPEPAGARCLAKADPTDVRAQRDMFQAFAMLGDMTRLSGDAPGAIVNYRQGVADFERLANADPTNARSQMDLFISQHTLGVGYQAALQFGDAKDWFEKAHASLQRFQQDGWIKKPEQLIGTRSFQKWSE